MSSAEGVAWMAGLWLIWWAVVRWARQSAITSSSACGFAW